MNIEPSNFDALPIVQRRKKFYPLPRWLSLIWPILVSVAVGYAGYVMMFFSNPFAEVGGAILCAFGVFGILSMWFHLREWFCPLDAVDLQILCGVSLPDPVQNLLADAVVRRQGLLRLYDVQPIVYALIRYRARIKAELQSRKRAATDLNTADIGGDVEQAAFALYQRFLSR